MFKCGPLIISWELHFTHSVFVSLELYNVPVMIFMYQSYLNPLGGVSSHLNPLGGVSSHLNPLGGVSSYLNPLGGVSSYLNPLGGVSSYLNPLGGVSSYLNPLGGVSSINLSISTFMRLRRCYIFRHQEQLSKLLSSKPEVLYCIVLYCIFL